MFLVVSAVALAAISVTQGGEPKDVSRIVVEGSGSVKNPPNVATISYDVQGEGRTSDQAVQALVNKSAAIESALRSMDSVLDLRTATVKVQAVRQGDCHEDRYDETPQLSTGKCAVVGFVATQDFNLRTSNVSDAGTMVGLAGRQGASEPKIEGFALAEQRDAKLHAIAAALADAKAKAEAIAVSSDARVGEVISITLDGARGEGDIVVTGSSIRRPSTVANAPVSVRVTPGPVETTAQVTVTYGIMR